MIKQGEVKFLWKAKEDKEEKKVKQNRKKNKKRIVLLKVCTILHSF